MKKRNLARAALAALMLGSAASQAATFTWDGSASTSWDDFNNWTPVGVPGSADFALLTGISPTPGTIDIRGPRLIRGIVASGTTGPHTFVNSGSGALTFFAGVGTTSVENAIVVSGGVGNGPKVFDCDISLLSNTAPVQFAGQNAAIIVNGNVTTSAASGTTNLVLTGSSLAPSEAVRVHGVISDGPSALLSLTAGQANLGVTAEVVVSGLNSYTGPTHINGAILNINSIANVGAGPNALGNPSLANSTISMGTTIPAGIVTGILRYTGAGHSSDRAFLLTGKPNDVARIESSGSGPLVLSGNVTTNGNGQWFELGGTNGGDNTFSGVINPTTGAGITSVQKSGASKWILTAANTYDGTTVVTGGTLVLQGAGAAIGSGATAGALTINGGTFILNGGSVRVADLNNAGGAFIFNSGTVELFNSTTATGAGSFTIGATGPGSLRLTGGSQNFGDIVLQGSDDSLVINAGGTYGFDSLDNSAGGLLGAVETVNIQMNGGQLTTTHGELRARLQGNGGLTKVGSGSLGISQTLNPNTYTGPTNILGGTLAAISLVTANQIPDTSPVTIAAGAVLDLTQSTDGERVGPLSGSGSVLTDQLEGLDVDTNGINASFAGAISGAGSFTKSGIGKQTLAGPNDYTGATRIAGGALEVTAGGSIVGSSGIDVSAFGLDVSGGTIDVTGEIDAYASGAVVNIAAGSVKASRIDRKGTNTFTTNPVFNWTGGTVHLTGAGGVQVGGAFTADRLFDTTATLDGDMSLIVDNTTTISSDGILNISGGTLYSGDVALNSGGVLNFDAGVLRLANDHTLNAAKISTLDIEGPLASNRALIIDGAATLEAPIILAGGAFSAASIVNPQNLILNKGTLNITSGPLDVAAGTSVDSSSGMNITAAGGLQVASTGQFNAIGTTFTGTAASVNDGEISAINSTLDFSGGLTNNGMLNLINTSVTGTLMTDGGGAIAGRATFNGPVGGSGNFTGSGTARFESEYSPGTSAAAVSFEGNVEFAPAATLVMELGGINPGSQFDQLNIAGGVALDGDLAVRLINSFVALPGQSFNVMNFASRSGEMNVVNQTAFAGLSFDPTYGGTSLTLVASALGGDANLDGGVNLQDFNILAANFGASGVNWLMADFTGDGLVSLADFNILAGNFGLSASPDGPTPGDWAALGSAVPEPTSSLVPLAASLLMGRRRQRERASSQ